MEDLQKEFIPYDRALKMKALGYNKPSLGYFDDTGWLEIKVIRSSIFVEKVDDCCLAPTFSQAFRFFREKYDMIAEFNWHFPSKCYATSIYPNDFYLQAKTYEEAELTCLDKLIEIVERKQNT